MFCTNCGTNLPEGIKFCTNCGQPQSAAISIQDNLAAKNHYQNKLKYSRLVVIIFSLFLGISVISVIAGLLGGVDLFKTIGSWMLGLVLFLTVICFVPCVIIGIVFISKAGSEQDGLKGYYKRIALWLLLGPVILFFGDTVTYVIINVAFNLIKGS